MQEWRKALEAWPDDPENGSVRKRLKEIAPEFIEIDQETARRAFEKARADLREGRFEEAAEGFREALRLFPESVDIRYLLATALARTGRLDAARPHFEQVANSPEGARFPGAMHELGNIFLVKGKPLIARAWYERYIRAMEEAGKGDDAAVAKAKEILEKLRQ